MKSESGNYDFEKDHLQKKYTIFFFTKRERSFQQDGLSEPSLVRNS